MAIAPHPLLLRCERYTLAHPGEVLLLRAERQDADGDETTGEETGADLVMIFRGFSSSLMRPTAFDPDVPILAATDRVLGGDRLRAPYRPDTPNYLAADLTPEALADLLTAAGIDA
ncbi:MAG: hypothetical protein MH825_00420 [Cyanobacteria bacterium]|nr:hypothetical protein [Cyanobacteriota bacterium]